MREIVLDTETTGLDPARGDRLVEIGCVELVNRMPTGEEYHCYINPEREVPEDAVRIHGLTNAMLADKPVFAEVSQDFEKFIGGAPLVIHNAAFDMKFLNAELAWVGHAELPMERAIDTLTIARKKYPGAQNSLDALCRRFDIDNSGRDLHGALIDSYLLAEVYLELTGGRQPGLVFDMNRARQSRANAKRTERRERSVPLKPLVTETDLAAHRDFVETELGEKALWLQTSES